MENYYPRGKFNDADEGALAMTIEIKDKTIILDFGKQLSWVGFDKNTAIVFANILISKANEI